MSISLKRYLARLATEAELYGKHARNPLAAMIEAGLAREDRAAVLSGEVDAILLRLEVDTAGSETIAPVLQSIRATFASTDLPPLLSSLAGSAPADSEVVVAAVLAHLSNKAGTKSGGPSPSPTPTPTPVTHYRMRPFAPPHPAARWRRAAWPALEPDGMPNI